MASYRLTALARMMMLITVALLAVPACTQQRCKEPVTKDVPKRDADRSAVKDRPATEEPSSATVIAYVAKGQLVAARLAAPEMKVVWQTPLGPVKGQPAVTLRYDGPFVVVQAGDRRHVLRADTGKPADAKPAEQPAKEGEVRKEAPQRPAVQKARIADLEKQLGEAEEVLVRQRRLREAGQAGPNAVERAERAVVEARERLAAARRELETPKKDAPAVEPRKEAPTKEGKVEGQAPRKEAAPANIEELQNRVRRLTAQLEELQKQGQELQRQLEQAEKARPSDSK